MKFKTLEFRHHVPCDPALMADRRAMYAGVVPDSYWEFVQQHGCGELEPMLLFPVPDTVEVYGLQGLEDIYGPCDSKHHDIKKANDFIGHLWDRKFIVFSSTCNGEHLLFDTRPESSGQVWIRAHDIEPLEVPQLPVDYFWENDDEEVVLYRYVASSFDEFIDMCELEVMD